MTVKKKMDPETLKQGDTVLYDGERYEVTDTFGDGKYAVIENKVHRFSVIADRVKKV